MSNSTPVSANSSLLSSSPRNDLDPTRNVAEADRRPSAVSLGEANADVASVRGADGGGRIFQMLSRTDALMGFTADVRLMAGRGAKDPAEASGARWDSGDIRGAEGGGGGGGGGGNGGRALHLVIPDARLSVPHEVRDMVGGHLHVTGALGAAALQEWAAETGQGTLWAEGLSETAIGAAKASSSPDVGMNLWPGILQV